MKKILLVFVLLVSSCSSTATKEMFAMDTIIQITVNSYNSDAVVSSAEQILFELDKELDKTDGLLKQINDNGGGVLSGYAGETIKAAYEFSEKTNGSFDLTVAPLIDLWGFYTKNYHVPNNGELKTALEHIGYKKISISDNQIELNDTKIDIDGIAKGYATDVIVENLKENNVDSALLSLGGNVYAIGKKAHSPWKIGIANPKSPSEYIGTVSVSDKAVVTSGTYQRNFTQDNILYHHILDPSTGKNPKNNLASVTVIGECAAECDALSTAFFVVGIDKSLEYLSGNQHLGAIFIDNEGEIYLTNNLENAFKSDKNYTVLN